MNPHEQRPMVQKIFRWSAVVEYQGTHYWGWQIQPDFPLRTVQGQVEAALSRVANAPVSVFVAGRTDAGVHAQYQVIHFETTCFRTNHQWLLGVNSYLPPDIAFKWVNATSNDFHARHSALSRTYQYIIFPAGVKKGLWYQWALYLTEKLSDLNLEQMEEALNFLLGEKDFTAFRSSSCQSKSPYREIKYTKISVKFPFLVITIQANSFLHHMVRNLVGSLLEVGRKRRTVDGFKQLFFEKKNRQCAGKMVSAQGLYLIDVDYPKEFLLPRSPFTFPSFFPPHSIF